MQNKIPTSHTLSSTKLPEAIIEACAEIQKRAQESVDPTQISYISLPPRDEIFKLEENYNDDTIISLIFRWIINVCQIIEDSEGNAYSVPIRPENIREKLEFNEIIADIVLYQVISWCQDRKLTYQDDRRSDFWENIWPHNCRIFSQGTYSIFDILWDIKAIPLHQIEARFYEDLKYIFSYESSEDRSLQDFVDFDAAMGDEMKDRILKNTTKLLDRYQWTEWKKLFHTQYAQAGTPYQQKAWDFIKNLSDKEDLWYKHELQDYENLITTLTNIKIFFEENYETVFSSLDFIKEDARVKFRFHLSQAWGYLKKIFFPKKLI